MVKPNGIETSKMLIRTDTSLTLSNAMNYYRNLNINNYHSTNFDAHITWTTSSLIDLMILSHRKNLEDYETMGELYRCLKNELLESPIVEKLR